MKLNRQLPVADLDQTIREKNSIGEAEKDKIRL